MKLLKCILSLILLFCFQLLTVNNVFSQVKTDIEESKIDDIFSEWDKSSSPGCAVGVYHKGELIFKKGYGNSILERNEPITPQTIFYAGSVSKQFTAAAVALLSIRGQIDLDHPVREYIPELLSYQTNNDPTVRELIHHTSGLPDLYSLLALYDVSLEDVVPFERMVEIITGQSHLNFEPGSEYMYSNSGYTLLAELVERVSGQTLRDYTTEHIFEPLGMMNTHFHDNRKHTIGNQAYSYQQNKNGKYNSSYLYNFEGVGPGGLYTTIEDMLLWDSQLYNNRLKNASGFNNLMHRRGILSDGDTLSYAFALVIEEYKGQKSVSHGGSFMGFKADYLRIPELQYGSTLLCNLGSINPSILNKELADVFLGKIFENSLHKYAGVYHSGALDLEYTIDVKNGNLYIDRKTNPKGKLRYEENNRFTIGGWELVFKESDNDGIESFLISSGRAQEIYFEKMSQ